MTGKTGKLFKRMLAGIALLTIIVLTQIPIPGLEAAASADFLMDGDKLVKYAGTANVVSVPADVRVIGTEAFADCSFLTGVNLPAGLKTIEFGAFSGCSQLRRIDVPSSVTKIGREAFANCKRLNKAVIGKETQEIEPGAFAGCVELKTVDISKENPYLLCEAGVVYNKDKTKLYFMCEGRAEEVYTMPSTVKDINAYAFWNCSNLKSVTLSSNLRAIPAYSFSNCNRLERVVLPYSVRSIDTLAFENCTALKEAEIPPSVANIHSTAFDGCGMINILSKEGTEGAVFAEALKEKQVSGNQAENKESSSAAAGKLENDNQVGTEDTGKIDKEEPAENNQEKGTVLGQTTIVSGRAVVFMPQKQTVYAGTGSINGQADADSGEISEKEIPERAYYRDLELTEYKIAPETGRIGQFAFARSALKTITIPEGVHKISYAAFYHCDNLEQVTIPSTVKEIGAHAFSKTKWMQNWEEQSGEEFLIVGDGILIAYRGNQEDVNIPDTVKTISDAVFSGRQEIKSVFFPDSLTQIGSGAFAECIKLSVIEGGKNIKTVAANAFADCLVGPVWKDKGIEP